MITEVNHIDSHRLYMIVFLNNWLIALRSKRVVSLWLLVAQQGRISIDVSDIREQVETCRDDVAWSELPLAAKLRVLIKERLAQIQDEKDSE
jgi:hypothetical protein